MKIIKIEYENNNLIKDDIKTLLDLIVAAYNDAVNKFSEKFKNI